MRFRAVRLGLTWVFAATLAACGGGDTASSPDSKVASSWSTQPVKVGPFAAQSGDQVATSYVATPLPRLNSYRDGWFNTGAPGQVAGIRYTPVAEVIVSEFGQLRTLPSPQHLNMGTGIFDMFMNLRGEILLDTASGLALWTDSRWQQLPQPTLTAGETLSTTKAVALNNVGQVLLEVRYQRSDAVIRSRAMLISDGQIRYLEGRPTALSDAGHIAVQEERQGSMQASVYQPNGEYLVGGRIPWGDSSYLPEVQTLLADGTALGAVYIPGIGKTPVSDSGTVIGKSLFRASTLQLELWPRGAGFDGTHYIDFFSRYVPFNRQGQMVSLVFLAPYASSFPADRTVSTLVINDQLFDLNALLTPSLTNPTMQVNPNRGIGDSGEIIHEEPGVNYISNSWLIQPAPRGLSVKP